MRLSTFGAIVLCAPVVAVTAHEPLAPSTALPVPVRLAASQASAASLQPRALLDQYCVTCHNDRLKTGGLALDGVDVTRVGDKAEVWEKVVRKMRGGVMPPIGRPRPDQATYNGLATWLETELDKAAVAAPHAGRKETFHRINRAEYQNAIRDVLSLDIDVTSLLPADDIGYGFDNNAGVLRVTDALMEQYLGAARKISVDAVGHTVEAPSIHTYRVKDTVRQDLHQEGLPLGTRGGTLARHHFAKDAEYLIAIEMFRVNRYPDQHELEVTLDGERIKLFTLEPKTGGGGDDDAAGEALEIRMPIKAGPHEIGVAFLKNPSATEVEAARARFERPYYPGSQAGLGQHLAVSYPAVLSVIVKGPYNATGTSDTPSRRRIFECRPATAAEETPCAKRILSSLAKRAYRRPVTDADLQPLLTFYNARRERGETFDAGIEIALQRLLMSPEFLFRGEADRSNAARARNAKTGDNFPISGVELASRLSFFLWSSVPDDQLIDLGARGRLTQPAVLDQQVRRMLADPRADALVSNFVGQWLYVRNLRAVTPSLYLYPDFDDTLRESFRQETEMFFASVLRENRSVLDLLRADYTFVDERLARHYGIPNIKGSHFRRVDFADDNPRHGLGLLGHGSILTVSSRPNRTSPVLRGKFVLDNLLGSPPPPPPANVPPLRENDAALGGNRFVVQPSMRERMAEHRANPVCAACHSTMDPLGFALENFDAVGQWRGVDERYQPIDTSGTLPSGAAFKSLGDFRSALVATPDRFASTVTERMLIYALGRGLEYYDMPAVRKIVRNAAPGGYTLQGLVQGIVKSEPFMMRQASAAGTMSASR